MERFDLASLEEILGIQPPWHITSVHIDHASREALIKIDDRDKKKLFGLIEQQNKANDLDQRVSGKWRYMRIGAYQCNIQAEVPVSAGNTAINLSLLNGPAFLGHPERNYSNFHRQQVALMELKGLNSAQICDLLETSPQTCEQIRTDISAASPQARALAFLPTEVDGAWRQVLCDKLHIRTNVLPLKLLLSKLKLAAAKTENAIQMGEYCRQLRQFFMANAHLMDGEVDQVCGLSSEHMKRQASVTKQRQKLVLPSLKNAVWIDLLTGKLNLNSGSVPLNLLMSRQRVTFLQAKDSATRIAAIETLREYFKKNHRSLRAELVLINRAMAINEKTRVRLPNPDHDIWQQILSDDNLVSSNHVAYKLLLSKLRAKVKATHDPVVKLEAARSIRNFMQQNHRSLQRELSAIVKQSAAV